MTRQTMTSPREIGPGEAAARARSRRLTLYFLVLAAIGGVVGFVTALLEPRAANLLSGGSLPPAFAIIAAIVIVGAVTVGSFRYYRAIDEFERRDNLIAGSWGTNILLGGYPVWLLLWKGGLAPEPQHFIMFLAVMLTTGGVYLYRKFI
jgi:hypothetical protein